MVGDLIAGDEHLAAGVADRERVARLAAHGRRHRLVEQLHPLLPADVGDEPHAELRERHDLEVDGAQLARDLERPLCVRLRRRAVAGGLRALELDPAVLGARPQPFQEALGAREPAARRRRVLSGDAVLAGDEVGGRGRAPHIAAPAVGDVRALARVAGQERVAQPEGGGAQPVEGARILRVVGERRLEVLARLRPRRPPQRCLPCRDAVLRLHAAIVADGARNGEITRRNRAGGAGRSGLEDGRFEMTTITAADPWGARARDWADVEDEGSRALFVSVLDELAVRAGTRLLDVGCGSGLLAALAAERGASVAGLDSSPGMLEVARERVPEGDFRLGEMTALPWAGRSFDVVTFVNSLFFAGDERAALRAARRVATTVAAVLWARAEATAYLEALAPLLPPLPQLKLFYEPAELEHLVGSAGLLADRIVDLDWTWEYPDRETLLRGWLSVGLSSIAIATAGEDAVRRALLAAAEPFRLTGGGYRLENVCRLVVAS